MKSLTSLKITQRIKQGLYEYCSAFYKVKERYPTIAEMNEAFYIPNLLELDTQQEVSEAVISKTANVLTEGVTARAFRPEVFRPERIEREGRDRVEGGGARSGRTISPEMIDAFNAGKSPEEVGMNPADFIQNLTPAEFVQYQTNRQKAIDAGSPVTDVDHKLGLRTPETPNEKPAEKHDERKDTDRQAVLWASERLGHIKRGEVQDMSPLDHALVAVDNVVGWITGKGEPTSKGVAAPVEEPPTEEEIPTTRPPEIETPEPAERETPVEVPEVPSEVPGKEPTEKPVETPEPQPKEQPVEEPVEKPVEVPVEEPVEKPDEKEVPVIIPVEKPVKPKEVTDVTPKVREKTTPETKEFVEPARRTERKPEERIDRREKTEKKRKPEEKEEKKSGIAAPAPSKSRPEEKTVEEKPGDDTPSGDPSGIDLERYHALRAGLGGVQVVQEGVYDPKRSLQKKEKKQKFKVVVVKEGGKKVEIFASSLRGVKRIVYGKQNYRVYNQSGSDMTSYFKRSQKGK